VHWPRTKGLNYPGNMRERPRSADEKPAAASINQMKAVDWVAMLSGCEEATPSRYP